MPGSKFMVFMAIKNFVARLQAIYYIFSELYETLKDSYEFYFPLVDRKESLLLQPRQIKARYGKSRIRPEFPVVYDEDE